MKNKFTIIVFSCLLTFGMKVFALENTPAKVALIFEDTIYDTDLEVAQASLNSYKRSYPDLSEEDVMDKVKVKKLTSMIWSQIIQKLSKEHDLEPTEEEIASYSNFINRTNPSLSSDNLTAEMKEFSQRFHRYSVKLYKLSKYLYETYGGTVIFQQGNPLEPIGAIRKLLENYEAQGDIEIYIPKYKKAFWEYYLKNHPMKIPQDKIDFSKPWWEKEKDKDK